MRSFTLVEMLISVAIFLGLSSAVYAILNVGYQLYQRDLTNLELQQNLRRAMERILDELREASPNSINISQLDDNNYRISFINYKEGSLVYQKDLGDLNMDTHTDQIIRQSSSGITVLANNVSYLKFTKQILEGKNYIDIEMEADKIFAQRIIRAFLKERVYLRNE
ncbi:MAG: prepilin-type N-terminal cleavage/methylation domain-containing protein [Candidatus Omnitrophica bacterium]|nr:prepilin-type N-terminal cleavage/methylation domain-containing protein [Candidatus Omnitrophota bacterium]MCM8799701.1 prepilin-type N-terminal cleavage/methylation domain-containing protein [Candidatus Omnitrophota bacterium]